MLKKGINVVHVNDTLRKSFRDGIVVLNIVSCTILYAPYTWLKFLWLVCIRVFNETLGALRYTATILRLLRPWGTRLTTPFPPQTSNRFRFIRVFGIYLSLQKWIRSTLFYFHMAKAWSMTMISFWSLVSILHLPELRFASQLLWEPPVIPTTKQNNTDKKLDFSMGRVFVQCDKSENTRLSILIKYILNTSA